MRDGSGCSPGSCGVSPAGVAFVPGGPACVSGCHSHPGSPQPPLQTSGSSGFNPRSVLSSFPPSSEIWGKKGGNTRAWVPLGGARPHEGPDLVEGARVPAPEFRSSRENFHVWALNLCGEPLPPPPPALALLPGRLVGVGASPAGHPPPRPWNPRILLTPACFGRGLGDGGVRGRRWGQWGLPGTLAPDTLGTQTATLNTVHLPHPVNSAERPPGCGSFLCRTPFASPGMGAGGLVPGCPQTPGRGPAPGLRLIPALESPWAGQPGHAT